MFYLTFNILTSTLVREKMIMNIFVLRPGKGLIDEVAGDRPKLTVTRILNFDMDILSPGVSHRWKSTLRSTQCSY